MKNFIYFSIFLMMGVLTRNQVAASPLEENTNSETITYSENQNANLLKSSVPSKIKDSSITARQIAVFKSTPNESKEEYLIRIARELHSWTKENKVEACGMIAKNDSGFSTVIGTSDSEILCDSIFIEPGATSTGETIHSHPRGDALNRVFISERTRQLVPNIPANLKFVTSLPRTFSDGDIATGHGYLVTDAFLMYQNGKGTEKTIAKL